MKKKRSVTDAWKKRKIDVEVPDLRRVWPFSAIPSTLASITRGIGKLSGIGRESRELRRARERYVRDREYEVRENQEMQESSWYLGNMVGRKEEEE